MKKSKILINFFIGGCIFIASVVLSAIVSLLLMKKNINAISFEKIEGTEIFALFLLGGSMFTIMRLLFEHITITENKKIIALKTQMILYGILLAIAIITLIISIYKSLEILKAFCIVFIFALLIYELGLYLANKVLKKNIEKINEKLKES